MYVGRRADVTRMMSQVWWIAFGCDATILNENVKMWRVSGVGTIVRAPLRRAPEKRGSATEKKERKKGKKKNCSMPALIWWPHEISGDNNGEWGYHVRTSVETRLDTAPTHFLQNLGHDTWWATGSVWKRVAQNEYRKTKTKTKTKTTTPPCTSGTKWCVSNGNMWHSKYARPQRSRFKFGQHLVTFSFCIPVYAGNQGRQQWSKFQFV